MTGPDEGGIDPADPLVDAVPLPPDEDDTALPLPGWDPLPPDEESEGGSASAKVG